MRFILFAVVLPFLILLASPLGALVRLALARGLASPSDTFTIANELGGIAWDLVTGFVTAPSTTQTALTMSTGDSLTVKASAGDKPIWLIQAWADNQTAGVLRIRSPRMHDNNQGLRMQVTASDVAPLLSMGRPQRLFTTDVVSVDLSGSATAGDIESAALFHFYEDVQGLAGRFIKADELQRRALHLLNIENTLALGTAGGWSGSEAINVEFDPFKANTDYALIGYLVNVECLAVAWRGADTGNLRVGGPGNETLRHVTAEWFVRLSQRYDLAAIPVFNSNNRGSITIDGAQDENGADVLVNSIFVELSGSAR
jgi:hypothetical protein